MSNDHPGDRPTEAGYRRHEIVAAWALHTATGMGVVVGYLELNSVVEGHARAAILWLLVALVLDGVDGPIARRLEVERRIPGFDGNTLDLIVDYFTCTIVPVAFLYRFDVLPHRIGGPVGLLILLVSALWMSRREQETEDGWFLGFPAEWNMVIPTLWLLRFSPWLNLAVCLVFCALTLSRVQFPHPLSVRERRLVSVGFLIAWLGSMLWLAIIQRSSEPLEIVLAVAPAWMAFQVVARLRVRPVATATRSATVAD